MELKKPTKMKKGTRTSQSSGERVTTPTDSRRRSLGVSAEGPTGVGGAAGTKKAGTLQTVEMMET